MAVLDAVADQDPGLQVLVQARQVRRTQAQVFSFLLLYMLVTLRQKQVRTAASVWMI